MNNPSNDQYFFDLFANTNDLIHFAKIDGTIEIINPSWIKTLGYKEADIIGKSIYDFIAEEDHELYRAKRQDAILSRHTDDFQSRWKKSNGDLLILEGNIRPFYSGIELVHTRGVLKDVTVKSNYAKKRENELSRLTQFLQNAPDAVVVIDAGQRVIEWNKRAEQIFGYSRDEALSQLLSELIIPIPYREAHKRGMQHFLITGEGPVLNTTIEVSAINKSEKELPISLSISNVKIDREWFFIAFMEDITDKMEKQQEFIRQQMELIEVKEDDKRNRDFLNIASHELKTPLTALKAFAQLALRGIASNSLEKTGEYLRKINETADKVKELIFSLLDISRIQTGKFEVLRTTVNYGNYLESIIETSRIIYPDHTIIFTNDENIEVDLDPIRLEQAVMNLINNAIKYSPGSNLIEIFMVFENHLVLTHVRDYGMGIQKTSQDRVFEKFYQLDDLPKTENSGLGIGLFITSEIIKQHDGAIWVQNNEDRGSTFSFSLPIKQVAV